jgi:hypothetical protein
LIALSEILREANKLTSAKYEAHSYETRRLAIKLVEDWITNIFGVAYSSEEFEGDEEENLFKRLDKETRLGRDESE